MRTQIPACLDVHQQDLADQDPWYAAFGVTPVQKMHLPPEKRVRVW